MAATAIYASRILTPHEEILDSVIVVEDGKITQMGHRDEVRIPEDSEHFAAGDKIEEIQEDYQLTRDQVMAALAYATHVAEHLPPAVKSA